LQETRFGLGSAVRERLRRELVRAGYFGAEAVNSYIFWRAASIVALPTIVYVFSLFFPAGTPWFVHVAVVSIAVLVAVAGPDAYLARRRRLLVRRYRLIFPDLLDLLVVCVDAGLTLDAAFDRVRNEVSKRSRELGMNLELMGAEMRAGRSMIEALNSLADRLGLDEAGSFVSMLRQSIELGSDVAEALRVFSDEMRDKRLLRAEEAANKLTVKMVLPLGLFIFPVVLLVVMLPVMIKLLTVLR
jgi:tight adherence protein C